jgi:hypothetical protein
MKEPRLFHTDRTFTGLHPGVFLQPKPMGFHIDPGHSLAIAYLSESLDGKGLVIDALPVLPGATRCGRLYLGAWPTFFVRNLGGLIHVRTRVPGRLGKATSRTPSMYVDEKVG